MEFKEIKKIWNEQKGETMYVINEHAMREMISQKKMAAKKRIDKVEISLSIINAIVAIILFIDALNDSHNWDYLGAGMMAFTVIYIQYFRWKRLKAENTFDRSMMGELNHAISNARYIAQFSKLMIFGYLLPFSIFYIGKMLSLGASTDRWLFIIGMYLLAFFLIYWERKQYHLPRKAALEKLKAQLTSDQ